MAPYIAFFNSVRIILELEMQYEYSSTINQSILFAD